MTAFGATSRRTFLARSAQAAAGMVVLRARPGHWLAQPVSRRATCNAAASLFPDAMESRDLRGLALAALDAARVAGASYADIRVGQRYGINGLSWGVNPNLAMDFSYGLRAMVDNALFFTHGCVPSVDVIVNSARNAVTKARGLASAKLAEVALAPVSVVQGEWTTPIHADPFLIPLNDQGDLVKSYLAMAGHVAPQFMDEVGLDINFTWIKEHRTYASTTGTLTEQTFYRYRPDDFFGPMARGNRTYFPGIYKQLAQLLQPCSGGYEVVLQPEVPARIKALVEAAREASGIPSRSFDVGRFPVVVDGAVLARLFGETVGAALEADRVVGIEAGLTGSSYLVPPDQVLQHTVINPLLTVTASRAMPHYQAVKWDDEGVETADYPVITKGRVMAYHTTRETAALLDATNASAGGPSRGAALADSAGDQIQVRMPHLTIQPGTAPLSDLLQGISRGLYVMPQVLSSMDQQLSTGLASPYGDAAFEIVNGKLGSRVHGVGLQFKTAQLWKNLAALGGESTVEYTGFQMGKGLPFQSAWHTASAPAGMFSSVDVLNLERKVS